MAVQQTAGRDALGDFASKFAQLNDDVLFGEVWSREDKLSLRDRSLVTVIALMSQGLTDSSFRFHLESAKKNGITKNEIAEILTHAAFYAGWPKAWAAFRMAKEVWEEETSAEDKKECHANSMIFPIGQPNNAYAQYFSGNSYLAPISTKHVGIFNVTFEQDAAIIGIFIIKKWRRSDFNLRQRTWFLSGMGEKSPGTVAWRCGKHSGWREALAWAASCSWFSHLAIEVPGEEVSNEWLEPVKETEYIGANQME